MRRTVALAAALIAVSLSAIVACNDGDTNATGYELARSQLPRQQKPAVDDARFAEQVQANNALALDMLKRVTAVDSDGFVGPHSISSALAMLQAGARGETRDQINAALHFVLPDDALHASFNRLDLALTADAKASDVDLTSANAVWTQKGFPIEGRYLDRLAQSYGAGVNLLDFKHAPEQCRETINRWVSDQTHERIPELFSPGAINETTRAVLTNAVYFKAKWYENFDRYGTQPAEFHTPTGSAQVSMMSGSFHARYSKGADYQAVSLLYDGARFSMLLVVPELGQLGALRERLDDKVVANIVGELRDERVRLRLPTFELRGDYPLNDTLRQMGMTLAFTPGADFSGVSSEPLVVTQVVHKTFLKVDERGTEAAAATGIVMDGGTAAPPVEAVSLTVDRPFFLFIRHESTGAILFAGQIVDPSTAGTPRQ